ncbi:hypothetical protein INT47_009052 [Mucor saturninus]|uniref:Uncharacterized protein n=1 Tax=Mucor saturninus TaxID=64648 RepID=A0A8H7RLX1_9FUNG|nr:hypothetical protein INT47_009052 [Mucor saturninus]
MKRKAQVDDKRSMYILFFIRLSSTDHRFTTINRSSFTSSTSDDTRLSELLETAVSNFEVPFNDNKSRLRNYFFYHQLKIIPNAGQLAFNNNRANNVVPTVQQLVKILNNGADNPFIIESKNRIYNCRIYLFSSRAKPIVIHPPSNSQLDKTNVSNIAIFKYCDSFITEWFSLELRKKPGVYVKKPSNVVSTTTTTLAAEKIQVGEKKPRQAYTKIGNDLDDEILCLLEEEVKFLSRKKWSSYQTKQKKKKSNMIQNFSESLSRISLPTGAAIVIKVKLEQKIKSNQFDTFKEADIPASGLWVEQKINRLKQQGKFTVDGFINNFIAEIANQQSLGPTSESSSSTSIPSFGSMNDTEIFIAGSYISNSIASLECKKIIATTLSGCDK